MERRLRSFTIQSFIVLASFALSGNALAGKPSSGGSGTPSPTPTPTPTPYVGTFGTNGYVTKAIGSGTDRSFCAAVQTPDQKILAAGQTFNGVNTDHAIVRYLPNANIDTSFGSSGVATTYFNTKTEYGASDYAYAIVAQSNGSIITGGVAYKYLSTGFTANFALTKWTSAGVLDSSFGSKGKVSTALGPNQSTIYSLMIQPDTKIVAVGTDIGGGERVALARYSQSGVLDSSFGSSGKALYNFNAHATHAVLQGSKILVSGGSNGNFVLMRFTSSGAIDNSWGTNGIVTTAIGSNTNAQAEDLALQSDGKIVAVGSSQASNKDITIVRYNADGSIDTAFGTNGIVTLDLGLDEVATGVRIQTDGRIVLEGYINTSNGSGGYNGQFVVARYNTDGTPDATFGSNGYTITQIGTSAYPYGLALQADGKIVLSGEATVNSNIDFAIARYTTDGFLDK